MKKIKKVMAIFFMLMLALSLVYCGNTELTEEPEEDANLVVIGFSQPGAESTWRVALTESVREAFSEEKGFKLIYKDGKSKQDNQIKDIRTFIQQGVDYIIISPIVETGWDAVLEEAKAAGIPVIICDRNVKVSNENLYTAFVGSNFKAEGEKAVAFLQEKYQDADELNIVHIQGTIGSSAQVGRTNPLEKAVEENEGWNIIAQECGDFTKAKAREIMENILEEIPAEDIDVIYCENDEEAMGVMACLNEAKIPYGVDKDITIISFDASASALELCLNGQINYELECNPLQGPYLYTIVDMLEKGEAVPKIAYIDEGDFTKDSLSAEIIAERKY